jgi:glycosyltransferase involved in cell wall biosynthesis
MKGVTAILPAFNEEVAIGSIVLRTRRYASRVIVIDDGSIDRTAEIAELAGAEVIRHPVNMGKGVALKTGFESVNGSEIIVTLDSDGQHDPGDIPTIVAPILRGEADIVNGSRYLNNDEKNTPTYRRFGQIVLDRVTNFNSGLSTTDSQSGFRAFAGHTKTAFRFNKRGLEIESEMLIDAANAGLRIKEVEIGVRYDVDGSTQHPLSHGLAVLVTMLREMEFNRPLYYFTAPGIVFSAIGIGLGLVFLRDFYHGQPLQFGPTLLMILLTLVGSFMALAGILMQSISQLLNGTRRGADGFLELSNPKGLGSLRGEAESKIACKDI